MAFCSFVLVRAVERARVVRPDLAWDVLVCIGMNDISFCVFSAPFTPGTGVRRRLPAAEAGATEWQNLRLSTAQFSSRFSGGGMDLFPRYGVIFRVAARLSAAALA